MGVMNIEDEIKDFFEGRNITIVGIAETGTLAFCPEEFSPHFILQGARSLVCYGVPIPKGILYADNYDLSMYWRYCTMLYKSMDVVSNTLCLLLEKRGHIAAPVYGCYPMRVVGHEYWGLVPLVYWAEEAGLGRITTSGLLAHPEYGTRMILGGVVTTADLPPSEKLRSTLCPAECVRCVDACPVHAIDTGGKVNHVSCMRYANASPLLATALGDERTTEHYSFETILNTTAVDEHATYSCTECMKVCPLNRK